MLWFGKFDVAYPYKPGYVNVYGVGRVTFLSSRDATDYQEQVYLTTGRLVTIRCKQIRKVQAA